MPPAFEFRGNRGGDRRHNHPRHEFTFRYARPHTSERPLLRSKRETTPEPLVPATQTGEQKPAMRFAPVSDLSDSEEEDMDVSDDDASHPRKKRALENGDTAPAPPPPAPKWSNPDPYTVLPPPDESQARKIDVVKMIRKSRAAGSAPDPQATKADTAVTTNEDFISLGDMPGDDDEDDDEEDEVGNPSAPDNAPRGPRGGESAFGNRKRTHEDELKGYSKKTGKPMSRYYPDASILDEWRVLQSQSGTPWLTLMPPTLHPGTRSVCQVSAQ